MRAVRLQPVGQTPIPPPSQHPTQMRDTRGHHTDSAGNQLSATRPPFAPRRDPKSLPNRPKSRPWWTNRGSVRPKLASTRSDFASTRSDFAAARAVAGSASFGTGTIPFDFGTIRRGAASGPTRFRSEPFRHCVVATRDRLDFTHDRYESHAILKRREPVSEATAPGSSASEPRSRGRGLLALHP